MKVDLSQIGITLRSVVIPTETGPSFRDVYLPFDMFYRVYVAINNQGISVETAVDIALVGVLLAKEKPEDLDERTRIVYFFDYLKRHKLFPNEYWEKPEDPILSLTYHLLRDRQINYKEAAEYASYILGRKFSEPAWKQRVIRWAKRRGLPKVGQRVRTPKEPEANVEGTSLNP
jgi:hypothetical protein